MDGHGHAEQDYTLGNVAKCDLGKGAAASTTISSTTTEPPEAEGMRSAVQCGALCSSAGGIHKNVISIKN